MNDQQKVKESCFILNKIRILLFCLEEVVQSFLYEAKIPIVAISNILAIIEGIENFIAEHMVNLNIPEDAIMKKREFIKFLNERNKFESTLDLNNMTFEEYQDYLKNVEKNYESFLESYCNTCLSLLESSTKKAKEEIDILKQMYGDFPYE
jgi:hypothetical protein